MRFAARAGTARDGMASTRWSGRDETTFQKAVVIYAFVPHGHPHGHGGRRRRRARYGWRAVRPLGALRIHRHPAGRQPGQRCGEFPAHYAAPYLQIDSADAGDMAADMSATGVKYYTLAFLTPQSGCTPEWEDNGEAVGAFTSQISSLKAAGGNVIISFGGADGRRAGPDLHLGLLADRGLRQRGQHLRRHPARLRHRGQRAVDDTAANTRRDQALAALQARGPVGAGGLHPGRGPERPGVGRARACSRTPRARASRSTWSTS